MKKALLLLFCMAAAACDDFFETDISTQQVDVIAPANGARISAGKVAFRWNRTTDAAGYRLLLVEPSFDSAVRTVADTLLFADSLSRSYGCTLTLSPGEYAWSVEAFNLGYETVPEIRSLTVTPTQEP